MKINNIKKAIEIFEEAATKQAEATELGDYKTGNRCYNLIIDAVTFLKSENAMDNLLNLLYSSSIGTRLWAASYLLAIHELEGIKTLEEIIQSKGIHSHTAEVTLSEWKKGHLKL